MSDKFDVAKVYINELKSIKNEYIRCKVEALEIHRITHTESIRERILNIIETWQGAKSSWEVAQTGAINVLKQKFRDLQMRWKYRNAEKYLIIGGAFFMSGYGIYLLYKAHKVRSDIIENYYRQKLEHKISGFNSDDTEILDIYSEKRLMASKYNTSTKLKKPTSSSKLVAVKINHQTSLNDLLNVIQTKLQEYESIMQRPFKTINTKTIDVRSQFRIMQWNGLAKFSVTSLKSPSVPKQMSDWLNFRKWRLLEELIRYNCDILCLEEADFYEDIKPYLHKLGYASVFCPKMLTNLSKETNNVDSDGCAIFYNLDVFQITQLRSQSICINGEHESQVFIIVQLKHKFTKKRVTIICVHLKAYSDFSNKRAAQTEFILKVLKHHVLETEIGDVNNQAVIICGDMNGDFLEPFYEKIVKDEVFRFRDVYPKFAHSNRRQKNAIDYIFYTDKSLNLMTFLEVCVPSMTRHFEIPCLEYPSDHFSLVCDFQIR